jgi:hypothetical protein
MGCLLAVFTWVLSRRSRAETESCILLAGFYVTIGSISWANASVLKYNLIGQPVAIGPVLIVVLLSVCALLTASSGQPARLGLEWRRGDVGDANARISPARDSARAHPGLRSRQLESASQVWHSRRRRSPGLWLGQ